MNCEAKRGRRTSFRGLDNLEVRGVPRTWKEPAVRPAHRTPWDFRNSTHRPDTCGRRGVQPRVAGGRKHRVACRQTRRRATREAQMRWAQPNCWCGASSPIREGSRREQNRNRTKKTFVRTGGTESCHAGNRDKATVVQRKLPRCTVPRLRGHYKPEK